MRKFDWISFHLAAALSLLIAPFGHSMNGQSLPSRPNPVEVLSIAERVADWQLTHPSEHSSTDWAQATGYIGFMALTQISSSMRFREAMMKMGEANGWQLGPSTYFADDHAVGQAYLELYALNQNSRIIAPLTERFDWILAHKKDNKLQHNDAINPDWRDKWSWCDSLFMAAPAWIRLYAITGKHAYLDFMVQQWWQTSNYLYDKKENLYFRDSRYFNTREANGKKVFWSRGNGWVLAGLARILQYLPQQHPARRRFVQQFREMADKIVSLQQPDGFWRASLLDAEDYPLKETTGTALFTYALAWGVGNSLLNREKTTQAILKGWQALTSAVDVDGKLTHVQPIGQEPGWFNEDHTDIYGVGAFLLAASAVYQLVGGKPNLNTVPLSGRRIAQVASWLQEKPVGPGPTIDDRVFWKRLAAKPAWRSLLGRASELLETPILPRRDDLYLEYTTNGNRTHWQAVEFNRRDRLFYLVLAECLENKGRFVLAIEQLITALCEERTWVWSAHDANLDNFVGKGIDIDLGSSLLGWNVAMADYLLGNRLRPVVRTLLRENICRRLLDPFQAMIRGQRPVNWWLAANNNWNSVCLAGVIGAGLMELQTRTDRAEFIVAAEKYSKHFLEGFTTDGYFSEGLHYWNYGFGRYALLSETIRLATRNRLDLLERATAKLAPQFGSRIEIINGISPAFADSGVFEKPSGRLMILLNRKLNLVGPCDEASQLTTFNDEQLSVAEAVIYSLSDLNARLHCQTSRPHIRDYFETAGVLISRPIDQKGMGVAVKGGNNAEFHNHNDLGSYVVVYAGRPVLLDPGPENYSARTFTRQKYESNLLNSFGHPVPLVAKELQREGSSAQAKVLKKEFSDPNDTLQLDITSAYAVPDLERLTRTFQYVRVNKGSLSVTDEVRFSTAETFGTALITLGDWQPQSDGSIIITDGQAVVCVEIDTGGRAFSLDATEIKEDATLRPTRIGINLREPVKDAAIKLTIKPGPKQKAALRFTHDEVIGRSAARKVSDYFR